MFFNASKALLMFLAGSCLVACGDGGTSKSSNNINNPQNKPQPLTPSAMHINPDNADDVASVTLKSIMLSEASTTALGEAVSLTQEQNSDIVNLTTGVVLTLSPSPCYNGGTVAMEATIQNANDEFQIDFNNPLEFLFLAQLNECDLHEVKLTGDITLDFTAMLNDLINNNYYDFSANLLVDDVYVEQKGYLPYFFDGQLRYSVEGAADGVVTTDIFAEQAVYTADESYQLSSFVSTKEVNQINGEYEYTISGEHYDDRVVDSLIQFNTLQPLGGVGFSIPTTGLVVVTGAAETMFISVRNDETLLLLMDYDNDGVIDEERHSTWQELVLKDIAFTSEN